MVNVAARLVVFRFERQLSTAEQILAPDFRTI